MHSRCASMIDTPPRRLKLQMYTHISRNTISHPTNPQIDHYQSKRRHQHLSPPTLSSIYASPHNFRTSLHLLYVAIQALTHSVVRCATSSWIAVHGMHKTEIKFFPLYIPGIIDIGSCVLCVLLCCLCRSCPLPRSQTSNECVCMRSVK